MNKTAMKQCSLRQNNKLIFFLWVKMTIIVYKLKTLKFTSIREKFTIFKHLEGQWSSLILLTHGHTPAYKSVYKHANGCLTSHCSRPRLVFQTERNVVFYCLSSHQHEFWWHSLPPPPPRLQAWFACSLLTPS